MGYDMYFEVFPLYQEMTVTNHFVRMFLPSVTHHPVPPFSTHVLSLIYLIFLDTSFLQAQSKETTITADMYGKTAI